MIKLIFQYLSTSSG